MSFVHLHNHTHYSLLDGLSRPDACVKIAKEQGSPAIAMTDHGVLYGAIEFYKAAKKEGINPILGCEVYVAPGGRFKKEPGSPIHHMILLAETNEGYQNLMQLVSKAHLEGFYYKPRLDHGLLKAYHKGIIALSGCLASEVSQAIINGNEEKAYEIIKMYQEIFGQENFYLEVQDHPELAEQIIVNQGIYGLSKRTGAKVVATNDNHYSKHDEKEVHDILLCIQTGRNVSDKDRMKYEGDFWIRSPEDMIKAFADHPEAIANTLEIAKRCKVEIEFGKNLMPNFATPQNVDQKDYLRQLCEEGMKERYGDAITAEMTKRLDYELGIIHNSGFDAYFLIVQDLIRYAKEKGVIVGPGRGSAAGSLTAYTLKITDIDPLKYGLLFERFLNPERVSMPDIDIDFDDERRNEVLDYVVHKYGRDNVAQIITFGTMAARAAVRDTGRAMGYPYGEVDRLAKLVPPPIQGRHVPLEDSIREDPELKKVYSDDPRAKSLFDNAIRLEGTVRHAGTHACAVVISREPLTKYTPLQFAPGDENVITQFSMKPIEELGLLKMDFLGLKNLTILREALITIEIQTGNKIDLSALPLSDKKTFQLLAKGETTGVFQLESAGMRRYLKELKPSEINDIIAMVSLYRPGPMPWIPMYIKGKHDPSSVQYIHESFEKILKETYGVAVYQEQILEIARDFAGFSLGEADILRKAVGKKDPVLLEGEREKFIAGAVSKGQSRKFAENVFEKVIEPFAAYGFNKSHATCYAMIAYQTAFLKAHYPAEFMSALLTADSSNEDRIAIEVNECESMGISVLPPSINESRSNFTALSPTSIRFGLKAIKGIGEQPIALIMQVREKDGKFKSLEDFFKRIPSSIANKKTIESLAYSGALDELGDRRAIAESVEEITKFAKAIQKSGVDGQTDIFGMMEEPVGGEIGNLKLKKVNPATRLEKLQWEKKYLGMFVSGHPLQGLKKYIGKKVNLIGELGEKEIGKNVVLLGILEKVKRVMTKGGTYMAYVTIEDITGRIEAVIFPRTFQQFGDLIVEGKLLKMDGKLEKRSGGKQFSAQSIKEVSLDAMVKNAKEEGLFDENEKYIRVAQEEVDELDANSKKAIDPNEPFIIELTEKMDAAGMDYLKRILMANRGAKAVVLHIKSGDKTKEIKVPFGVEVTGDLKRQIGEIAK